MVCGVEINERVIFWSRPRVTPSHDQLDRSLYSSGCVSTDRGCCSPTQISYTVFQKPVKTVQPIRRIRIHRPVPSANFSQVVQNPQVSAQLNSMHSWLLYGLVVPVPSDRRITS